MGGDALGERQGLIAVTHTHLVGELILLRGRIRLLTRMQGTLRDHGSDGADAIRHLSDVGAGDHQQREQADYYEDDDGEHLRQSPCQRRAQHETKQSAGPLQQADVERTRVGGHDHVDDRADGPQQYRPAAHHAGVVGILAAVAHQTDGHDHQQHRQHDAHHAQHAGRERMQHPADDPVHAEPFGSAEEYGEHDQQEAQAIPAIHGVEFTHSGNRPNQ